MVNLSELFDMWYRLSFDSMRPLWNQVILFTGLPLALHVNSIVLPIFITSFTGFICDDKDTVGTKQIIYGLIKERIQILIMAGFGLEMFLKFCLFSR